MLKKGAVFALRGATTIEADTEAEISQKTKELYFELERRNNLKEWADIVSIVVSTTADITAAYPAKALREAGITDVALFSCLEPPIKNSLPLCIRLLVTVACSQQTEINIKHCYLNGAKGLRTDLD